MLNGLITIEELSQVLVDYIDSKKITSVNGSMIADGTVTEPKLHTDVKNKLNKDTYTKTETNTKIDDRVKTLIGAAPGALDTLVELANALGNDANFAATITTKLGEKVDKVSGKQLSTNDYTKAEKDKLAGIATSANNYVHPANHPASVVTQDASNRFVTDAEKSTWNGKASTAVVTTTANGLMTKEDKVKLNSLSTNFQPKIGLFKNTVTLSADTRIVSLGITGFDRTKHLLMVFRNSVYLEENSSYTISSDNLSISPKDTTYTFKNGTIFNFIVMKI